MFPIVEVKLDGLYPERTYAVVVDIVPADQYHWKFTGTEWRIGGPRCEPPMPSRLYVHQESPSSGLHWMQDILGFGKLKITNDKATPGHEVIQSLITIDMIQMTTEVVLPILSHSYHTLLPSMALS